MITQLVDSNMIAIDLSKQQVLGAAPKAIQQINFTGKAGQSENTTLFFIPEEAKETISYLSQGTREYSKIISL